MNEGINAIADSEKWPVT